MLFQELFESKKEESCCDLNETKTNSKDEGRLDCDFEPSDFAVCSQWSDSISDTSSLSSVDSNESCCEKENESEDESASGQSYINKSPEPCNGSEASSATTSLASTLSYRETYSNSDDGSVSVKTNSTGSHDSRNSSEVQSIRTSASTASKHEKDVHSEDGSVSIQTESTASVGLLFDEGCVVDLTSLNCNEQEYSVSQDNSTLSLASSTASLTESCSDNCYNDSPMLSRSSTEDEDLYSNQSMTSTNFSNLSLMLNNTDMLDENTNLNCNVEIVNHPLSNNSKNCLLVFQDNLAANQKTVYEV